MKKKALKEKYVVFINTARYGAHFVSGFCEEHSIVQFCNAKKDAKKFRSPAHAEKWLSNYCDAGYGLSRNECRIQALSEHHPIPSERKHFTRITGALERLRTRRKTLWWWEGVTPLEMKVTFKPREGVRSSPPAETPKEEPLDSTTFFQKRKAEMAKTVEEKGDFNSLLALFNGGTELVRKNKNGTYSAVKSEKRATHRLVATRWNHEEEHSSRALWTPTEEEFATSVCAEPLHLEKPSRPSLSIKRPYPRRGNVPVYRRDANEEGKRRVLKFIVKKMGASVKVRDLKGLGSKECDSLYDDLIRASRLLLAQRERARAKEQKELQQEAAA